MMDGTLLGRGGTAYEQGTSYLAMLLMSSYESSFGFQKTLVAHTNTEKKADFQAVEIYVTESVAGAQGPLKVWSA